MALIDNLISYYKLDETSGTTATDSHGSNNGTNNGATVNQTGKIGTSYSFATNDYVSGIPEDYTNITYNFWMYSAYGASDQPNLYARILSASNDVFALFIHRGSNNMQWKGCSIRPIISGADLTAVKNTWAMYTATYDGTSAKLYLNGILKDTKTCTFSWGTNLYIGMTTYGLVAKMDELGVWSKALNQTQITELYNSGAGLAYPFTTATLRLIKISGSFVDKPILTKVAGSFVDKPIKIKVGGTFQ